MKAKKINITKSEKEFLNRLASSEYCELEYQGDWVSNYDYDMKVVRGLMTSLAKKGIVHIDPDSEIGGNGQPMTWVSIDEDYIDLETFKLKI